MAANYSISLVLFIIVLLMSSLMCIPTMIDCCVSQFGRDRTFCQVMVPTIVMTNKLLDMVCLTMIPLCCLFMANGTVTWGTMILFAFMVFLLSYATPSVPGGMIATITMLFHILGVPMSYMGLVAMVAPFMEFDTGVQTISTTAHVLLLSKDKDESIATLLFRCKK